MREVGQAYAQAYVAEGTSSKVCTASITQIMLETYGSEDKAEVIPLVSDVHTFDGSVNYRGGKKKPDSKRGNRVPRRTFAIIAEPLAATVESAWIRANGEENLTSKQKHSIRNNVANMVSRAAERYSTTLYDKGLLDAADRHFFDKADAKAFYKKMRLPLPERFATTRGGGAAAHGGDGEAEEEDGDDDEGEDDDDEEALRRRISELEGANRELQKKLRLVTVERDALKRARAEPPRKRAREEEALAAAPASKRRCEETLPEEDDDGAQPNNSEDM
jgi:hypothetical protein